MAKDKVKRPTYTTPIGVARYPHLNKPDTKYKAEGQYKCDLVVPADAAADLIAQLEKIRDEFYENLDAKVRKTHKVVEVVSVELDDEGNETGNVIIKTKLDRVGHDKKSGKTWTNEPKLFDSEGNPTNAEIWSGSKLIIAGTVMCYANATNKQVGVSLKCNGVQIIELRSGGERDASSFGFKKQNGYKAPSAQQAAAEAAGDSDDSDGGSDAAEDGDEEF
jgi:hypothetical protein